MKRTELQRKTPIARAKPLSGILHTANLPANKPRQKRMKSTRPKTTPIRKSAKGEACTMRIPGVCNWNTETTVWAHSNKIEDGKGMGIKARDEEGCYACSDCHDVLDGRRPRPSGWTAVHVDEYFDVARKISQEKLKRKGLLNADI